MAERVDEYAEMRGHWLRGGWWRCDCRVNWPQDKRKCSRCKVLRPLKNAPVHELRDPLQGGGFIVNERLYPTHEAPDAAE